MGGGQQRYGSPVPLPTYLTPCISSHILCHFPYTKPQNVISCVLCVAPLIKAKGRLWEPWLLACCPDTQMKQPGTHNEHAQVGGSLRHCLHVQSQPNWSQGHPAGVCCRTAHLLACLLVVRNHPRLLRSQKLSVLIVV